jgi:glyoxylase I family protein
MLKNIAGEYAFVAKVNVSNMDASAEWYVSKLDLVLDPRYLKNPSWKQLNTPGIPRFAIGLNLDAKNVGTAGAAATFVVAHIDAARDELRSRGVEVDKILDVGQGVKLASFKDLDKNALMLRQNSPTEPLPSALGWSADRD